MADQVEITDVNSAKAWLETQDHQTQVWFATRCAFRTLPNLGTWEDATKSGLALLTCRAMLISAAAATCPAAEMKKLETAAHSAHSAANSALSAHSAAHSAHSAANSARSAANSALSAAHSAHSAANSANSARSAANSARSAANPARSAADPALSDPARSAAWVAATNDANAQKNVGILWPTDQQPEVFKKAWEFLKGQWQEDAPHWSFWIEWYEAVRDGTWTNWDLIYKIATTLADEDWEKGAAHVAKQIQEIEDEFLIGSFPQVNEIFETEDGLYEVRGTVVDTSKLMQSVLDRVTFALETAVQSNMCDLNEMSLACKILRQALLLGEDDANAVEQYLRRASSLIKSGIEKGNYAEDDEIEFLTDVLDETALQLRGDHPEVAEAYTKRLETRLREVDGESRIKTAILIDDLREGTAQRLNAGLKLAADVARDGSSVEATADVIKESGNTAGKISVLERAKRAEGSGQMAITKMAVRAQGLADWVVSLISGGG